MSKRKLFQKLRGIWRKRVLKKKVRSKRRLQTDGLETYNRPIVNRFDEVNQRTPDKSMGELMRKLLLDSTEGRYVLGGLLTHWGFFREANSVEEMIEQNIAKDVLWYMGVWHEDNTLDILDKLRAVRPRWHTPGKDTT